MLTKIWTVKTMFFLVIMSGCERWTIKKAEGWISYAFGMWFWRRLLRVPARRRKQIIWKEISPKYLLEGLMLKLDLQYFGQLMGIAERPWFWEKLKAGGEGDNREWDGWLSSLTGWTWVWASSRRWWWTEKLGMLQSMGSQRVRHDWATEEQQQLVKLRKELWRSVIPREIDYSYLRATWEIGYLSGCFCIQQTTRTFDPNEHLNTLKKMVRSSIMVSK